MSASSTLLDVVPGTVRKVVYSLFGTLGVAVGGVQVAYSAAGLGQPVWLTVATSVLVFLGIPVSATALLHVTPASTTTTVVNNAPAPVAAPAAPPVQWPPTGTGTTLPSTGLITVTNASPTDPATAAQVASQIALGS